MAYLVELTEDNLAHELLARTVLRLAPNLEAELQVSGKEFVAENDLGTIEENQALCQVVEFHARVMAYHIKAEQLANQSNPKKD